MTGTTRQPGSFDWLFPTEKDKLKSSQSFYHSNDNQNENKPAFHNKMQLLTT